MLWAFGGDFYQIRRRPGWSARRPCPSSPRSNPRAKRSISLSDRAAGDLRGLGRDRRRHVAVAQPHPHRHDRARRRRRPRNALGDGRADPARLRRSCSRSAPDSPAWRAWSAGTFQSISPGEDTRFLLASLVVVIVGGMGSIPGAALGALHHRPRRADRARSISHLCDRPDLPHHGVRAGRAAAGPAGGAKRWRSSRPARPAPLAGAAAAAPRRSGCGAFIGRRRSSPSILLIMPALANEFVLFQIFSWSFILGIIALSLMFLAGYGGMVSLAQMTIAGFAGYIVRDLRRQRRRTASAWAGRGGLRPPMALAAGDRLRHDRRRARGAHRGHLHHHDHARDRLGVLLSSPTRTTRSSTAIPASTAWRRRIFSASTGARRLPFYYLRWRRRALLCRRRLPFAGAVRTRAAGRARQSAADGGARLQRQRPSRRRLRLRLVRRRRSAASSSSGETADLAGHGRRRRRDRHPHHRGRRRRDARRSAPSSARSSSSSCAPSPSTSWSPSASTATGSGC